MAHVDKFYQALGKSRLEFEIAMERDFIGNLAQWRIRGGASTSQRKKAVQEAVDALEVYARVCFIDGDRKRKIFRRVFYRHYKNEILPEPSNVWHVVEEMKKLEAHYNILMAKFCLLDYWCAVVNNTVTPDYEALGPHWALQEFLNFDPVKVRPILELLLKDAEAVLSKPYSASLEKWRGYKAESSLTRNKTEMADVINAEATFCASAGVRGNFDLEYKGFKINAKSELLARANASANGEICITPAMLTANANVEVDVTVRLTGQVNVDVLDILQLEAGIEGIAGALAKAGVELEHSVTGVKLTISAEAFAGLKISGTAKATLTLGGRPVISGQAEASAYAGIGASAGVNFECGLFGKVSFGAKAGAVVGIGAEAEAMLTLDFHNARWAAETIFWARLRQAGFKNKGRVWLLPLKENHLMAAKCREELFKMMGQLYNNNEADLDKLDAWHLLEKRVALAVRERYPRLRRADIAESVSNW